MTDANTKALLEQVEMLKTQLGEMVQAESVWISAIGRANGTIRDLKAQLEEAKKETASKAVVETPTQTPTPTTPTTERPKARRFATEAGIVVTPVSKTMKKQTLTADGKASPDSCRDYKEQCDRRKQGQVMCWDDADANKTRVGDMFAFRHQEIRVEIHQVLEVNGTDQRLPSWSRNVGHSARNVLILTNPIYTMNWEEWTQFGWHASGPLLGTQRVANGGICVQMLNYVNEKMSSQ